MCIYIDGYTDRILKHSYADAISQEHITEFVKTYDLEKSLDQLAEPDLSKYKTFNSFFSRALKPDARPADGANDPKVVVSAADCRCVIMCNIRAKYSGAD